MATGHLVTEVSQAVTGHLVRDAAMICDVFACEYSLIVGVGYGLGGGWVFDVIM